MPEYTENFAHLRFGGTAWDGLEEWSCGLKLRHNPTRDLEPMQAACNATIDDIVDLVSHYVQIDCAINATQAPLNWVRLNVIKATDGKYAYPNAPIIVEGLNVTHSSSPGVPQLAVAITLRGLPQRGPAAFGRWFIPAAYYPLENDGQLAMNVVTAAAGGAADFLGALAAVDHGAESNVWSPWLYGTGLAGSADSAIQEIKCGRVYDTQRRRRNTLLEDYFVTPRWAAGAYVP